MDVNNEVIEVRIAEYSETTRALADLRQRYAGVIYDVSKPAEMEAARKARRELLKLRTSLEAKRVEIKAPALERSRLIDAEARRITAELLALEEPIDQQIQQEETRKANERAAREQAERERVAGIRSKLEAMRGLVPAAVSQTTAEIAEAVAGLQSQEVSVEAFADFVEEATRVRNATLAKLGEMYDAGVAREAEDARLKAEREQLERDQAAERERQRVVRALEELQERDRKQQREQEEAAEQQRQREARLREEAEERVRAAERARVQKIGDFIAAIAHCPLTVMGRGSTVIGMVAEELRADTAREIEAGEYGEFVDRANAALSKALDELAAMKVDAEKREAIAAEEQRQAAERERLAAEERRQQEVRAEQERQREIESQRAYEAEQRAATHRERLKGYAHMTPEAALYAISEVCRRVDLYDDAAARDEAGVICEAILSRDKKKPTRTRRAAPPETTGAPQ